MSRRLPLLILFLVAKIGVLPAAERPHIVLIMCDDMGFSDIGCYGGEIRTPNIDRLAQQGLRFTQFYNNAKCTTTRASLITGLYPRPSGGLLKSNMLCIPEVLAEAGYRSVLTGKWHLGSKAPDRPGDRGFDHAYGLLDGCCNYFNPARPDPDFKGRRVRWFGENNERITTFPDDFYTTDAFTDRALEAIDEAAQSQQPLFLHVCYTAPHYPLHAPPEDIARYRGKYREGWTALRQARHQRQRAMGLIDPAWKLPGPDPEVPDWDSLSDREQDYYDHLMATYAAMIDRMDQNIGRLLQRLEQHGLAENTLVMFLSDNGGCAEKPGGIDTARTPGIEETYTACGPGWAYAQNTPFRRFKSYAHEGGIATPLIVRWPGRVQPGSVTSQVGHIIDLLPTCADVAGVEIPSTRSGVPVLPVEGLSLRPIFEGGTREGHDRLFWEWGGSRAVRDGDWKLAWDSRVKRWELYDLANDRTEMNDLSSARPELVEQLSDAWLEWAARTGVKRRP